MSAIDKIEDLAAHIKDYVNTRIELIKLRFASATSKIISNLISFIVLSAFLLLFIIFLGIAAALLIGEKTGCMPLGFLSVGLFFLILGLLCWKFREKLIRIPVMNSIIRQWQGEDE